MNNIVIVERIASFEGNEVIISVNRNYKNEDGIYMSDLIPVCLGMNMTEQMTKYCKVGDMLGIKGHLENRNGVVVMAEKVSFLSSKKSE